MALFIVVPGRRALGCHTLPYNGRDFLTSAQLYRLDPLTDPRWMEFVQQQPNSSIFHTPEWLRALRESFGYEPLVITSNPPGERLTNGVPFCRVRSWLTGNRLVSIPFSDHCEPLGSALEVNQLLRTLPAEMSGESVKYIEIRPLGSVVPAGFSEAEAFCRHTLDLTLSDDQLFHNLHKSCLQRRIQKANRIGLQYDEGSSGQHLEDFYRLFVMTRKRLHLPPQPLGWFRRLVAGLREQIKISAVLHNGQAIASMITLFHQRTATYKYGCSNAEFHHLGGVPYLFWQTILRAKERGAELFDFGRSDLDATGLITFKNRWGTSVMPLVYLRSGKMRHHKWEERSKLRVLQSCVRVLPENVLVRIGNALYRHIG